MSKKEMLAKKEGGVLNLAQNSDEKIYLEHTVHSIPERQEQSFGDAVRWKNFPMQIYPEGYVPIIPGAYSLLDLPDYSVENKIQGAYKMAKDIARMNVVFVDEPLFLRQKAAELQGYVKILEDVSRSLDDPQKKEALEKIEALFPQHLNPRLRDFLLYNLHQDSLVESRIKVVLLSILLEHYNLMLPSQASYCNEWWIEIQIAKDGNGFSITNTHVIDCCINLSDERLRFIDPIKLSTTVSFGLADDGSMQVIGNEISIESSDENLVKIFENKVSEVIYQNEITYHQKDLTSSVDSNDAPGIGSKNEAKTRPSDSESGAPRPLSQTLSYRVEEYENDQTMAIPNSGDSVALELTGNIGIVAPDKRHLCQSALDKMLMKFSHNENVLIQALMQLITAIQKEGFAEFSDEQLVRFYNILPLFENYGNVVAKGSSDKEALSLNAVIVNKFYSEALGKKVPINDPLVTRMRTLRARTEGAVSKGYLKPEVAAATLDQVNLELVNCMSYLALPKKSEFKPVLQKKDWNRIEQMGMKALFPQKKWARCVLIAVGVTLAIGLSAALIAGVLVATGGLGAAPLAAVGAAVASALSPNVVTAATAFAVAGTVGVSIGLGLSRVAVKENIRSVEACVDGIKEPVERQKLKLEEESRQKGLNLTLELEAAPALGRYTYFNQPGSEEGQHKDTFKKMIPKTSS